MTLEQQRAKAIADILKSSTVGLFRDDIFKKVDQALFNRQVNMLSTVLSRMKTAGHVVDSQEFGTQGSRWTITPQGRIAFSTIHQETEDEIQKNDEGGVVKEPGADDEVLGDALSEKSVIQPGEKEPDIFQDEQTADSGSALSETITEIITEDQDDFETLIAKVLQKYHTLNSAMAVPVILAPTVEDKEITLATLRKVAALMSDDIKERLDYAASVLEQLEAA